MTSEHTSTAIEQEEYIIKVDPDNVNNVQEESDEGVLMVDDQTSGSGHGQGQATEYKLTYHDGNGEEHQEVIIESTEEEQQQYYQNGGGGNLYIISNCADGYHQEGQLIASADLFEAANAVGGAQIVNISNLAELEIATTTSDIIDGQQHVIINGTPMVLESSDMMGSTEIMEQGEEIVVGEDGAELEDEEHHETNVHSEKHSASTESQNHDEQLIQFHDMKIGGIVATEFKNSNHTYYQAPVPEFDTSNVVVKIENHNSSIDATISEVIKQSAFMAQKKEMEYQKHLENFKLSVSTAAAAQNCQTPKKDMNDSSLVSDMDEKPTSSNATQPHTIIMVKDKRKRPRLDRDPMALPFSYAGQSFNVQAQKLILNVMNFFKTHKRDEFIDSIRTPQEKAARVLNVSSSVIGKIRKNFKSGRLEQPGKKRQMTKRVLDKVNTFDEEIIRKIIKDISARRQTPTIPMILAEAREKIGFVGSRTSFRRILHRMGYKYGKIEKKTIMIEPGSITNNMNITPLNSRIPPSTATPTQTLPRLVATTTVGVPQIPLTRPPPQIQIKREKDSVPVPMIINNGLVNNFIVPRTGTTVTQNIQQPRQIIIQQSTASPLPQQYYTIQPHQLNQLNQLTTSRQPQIIHIIQTNQRTPQSS